jgi:hypothetical protein
VADVLDDLFLIVLDESGSNLREAVQEMVKQHTEQWWHQMPNVWIVQGDSAKEWRDRILPLKTAAGSNALALVVKLPNTGRSWAATGQTSAREFAWFREHYIQHKPN